jgi:hypothetical protein
MVSRILILLIAAGCFAVGAELPDWYTRTLENVEFAAKMVRDVKQIEQIMGDSLDGDYILMELKVKPLYGTHVVLNRDDFLLRSRRDNDTSDAQSPARIAGDAVLSLGVTEKSGGGNVFRDATNSPIWGGAPGTNSRPRRLEDDGGLGGSVQTSESSVTLEQQQQSGDTTLAGRLASLEVPLDTTDDPVAGYLYFQVPAKVKRKHLELSYDGKFGEFVIEFKKPE